jgi:TM2 domain-containing membrane protein YozV
MNTISLFLILSAGSKNLWYDGPLYPLFAVIIGLFLGEISKMYDGFGRHFKYILKISHVIILVIIFIFPYISIIKKVSRTTEDSWDREIYSMGYILRNPIIMNQLPNPLKILYEGYNAHLLFYVEAENYRKNDIRLSLDNFTSVKTGDAVMFSQAHVLDSIERKFNYEIIYSNEPVSVIRITEP